MKNKCTAVFLSFVTEGNKGLRQKLFFDCFPTFESIKSENARIDLQLVAVDNVSIPEARERIEASNSVDVSYLLDKNMFDTALFCAGLDAAEIHKSDYVLFTYDDFFVFNPAALSDVVHFMEVSNADCCRVTEYDVRDSRRFNSEFTPKTVNPDAIRHSNTATGQKIDHKFFGKFGESEFYLTNWHYTSRPCVWRASKLKEVMSKSNDLKILQGFEGFMVSACQDSGVVFATLDKGMMRTFPVQLSARTSPDFAKRVDEVSHTVAREEMNQTLERCRITKGKE
jgi:hypothetical protein